MSLANFLSTVTTSLIKTELVHANNSTNYGAHEVSNSGVTLQEEGGVHIFEIHLPSIGMEATIAVLATLAAVGFALLLACCCATRACLHACCPRICCCRMSEPQPAIHQPEDNMEKGKNIVNELENFIAPMPKPDAPKELTSEAENIPMVTFKPDE